jgi:hypothetical protein
LQICEENLVLNYEVEKCQREMFNEKGKKATTFIIDVQKEPRGKMWSIFCFMNLKFS